MNQFLPLTFRAGAQTMSIPTDELEDDISIEEEEGDENDSVNWKRFFPFCLRAARDLVEPIQGDYFGGRYWKKCWCNLFRQTFFACVKCRASSSSSSRRHFLLADAFVATGLLKIFIIIFASRSFFAICPSEHILRSTLICAVVVDSSLLLLSSGDKPPAPGAVSSGVVNPSVESENISNKKRFVFVGKKSETKRLLWVRVTNVTIYIIDPGVLCLASKNVSFF